MPFNPQNIQEHWSHRVFLFALQFFSVCIIFTGLSSETYVQLPYHKTSPGSNWPREGGQGRVESARTIVIIDMLERYCEGGGAVGRC